MISHRGKRDRLLSTRLEGLLLERLESRILLSAPIIQSLEDSPDPVHETDVLTLTARNVVDPDGGAIVQVRFYRDSNGNGTLQVGTDPLMGYGTQIGATHDWQLAQTASWSPGTYYYFAVAQDQLGESNQASPAATVGRVNDRPTITSLTGTPQPIGPGDTLTLQALGVTDTDGVVSNVDFYRDSAVGTIGSWDASDLFLGRDNDGSNGWTWQGEVTWQTSYYFARPRDNDGAWGAFVTGTVNQKPTIAFVQHDPNPIVQNQPVTFIATGASDPNGSVASVAFYRDVFDSGHFNPAQDQLLGYGVNFGSGEWRLTVQASWQPDISPMYFAVAQDNQSQWGNAVWVLNENPALDHIEVTPDVPILGEQLTLDALGVTDVDGFITEVLFSVFDSPEGTPYLGWPHPSMDWGWPNDWSYDTNGANGWTWTIRPDWRVTAMVPGDFDLDGDVDVALAVNTWNDTDGDGVMDAAEAGNYSTLGPDFVAVLRNDGSGEFWADSIIYLGIPANDWPYHQYNPSDIAAGDMNNDGFLDLVVANSWTDRVSVLLNNGDGTFGPETWYETDLDRTPGAANIVPHALDLGDLNADGNLDVAVLSYWDYALGTPGGVSVLFCDGTGALPDANADDFPTDLIRMYSLPGPGYTPEDLAIADLDQDGYNDLAIVGQNGVLFLWNNGFFQAEQTVGFFGDPGGVIGRAWETGITGTTEQQVVYDYIWRDGSPADVTPDTFFSYEPPYYHGDLSGDDYDMYRVTLEQGALLHIRVVPVPFLDPDTTPLTTDIAIWNSSGGQELYLDDAIDPENVGPVTDVYWTAPSTGNYYVGIGEYDIEAEPPDLFNPITGENPVGVSQEGEYELTLEAYGSTYAAAQDFQIYGTVAGDIYETNNASANAWNLGTVTGWRGWYDLAIGPAGDEDWFSFDLLAGGTDDIVRIEFTHAAGNLDLEVYDSALVLSLFSYSTTDNEQVSLDTLPAGTYYVRVFEAGGGTNPSYNLVLHGSRPGIAGDLVISDDVIVDGLWETGEDIWVDANTNGTFDGVPPDVIVSGAPTLADPAVAATNLFFVDSNGDGLWTVEEDVWADLNANGIYDESVESPSIYGGAQWTTPAPTVPGNVGGLFFSDTVVVNGRWDPGEDIWADDPAGAPGVYNQGLDLRVYNPLGWTTANLAVGTVGNLWFYDTDGNGVWGDGAAGWTQTDLGEFIWAELGINQVYNPGVDVQVPATPELPIPDGTFGTRADIFFNDVNQNRLWDFGEDMWADVAGSFGQYNAADTQVYGGGDPWTTATGRWGIQGRIFVVDRDGDGAYDWGEGLWGDGRALSPDEPIGAGDSILVADFLEDNHDPDPVYADGWVYKTGELLDIDVATANSLTNRAAVLLGNHYLNDEGVDVYLGLYPNEDRSAMAGAGAGAMPALGLRFSQYNNWTDVQIADASRVYNTVIPGYQQPYWNVANGQAGIQGNVYFWDIPDANGVRNQTWDWNEDLWADVGGPLGVYNAGVDTPIYNTDHWDVQNGERGIQGNVWFRDANFNTVWNSGEDLWADMHTGTYLTGEAPTSITAYNVDGDTTKALHPADPGGTTDWWWAQASVEAEWYDDGVREPYLDLVTTNRDDGSLSVFLNAAGSSANFGIDERLPYNWGTVHKADFGLAYANYRVGDNNYDLDNDVMLGPFDQPGSVLFGDFDGDGVQNMLVIERLNVAALEQAFPFHTSDPLDLDPYECEIAQIGLPYGFDARYSIVRGYGDKYSVTYYARAHDEDYDPINNPQLEGFSVTRSLVVEFNQRPQIWSFTADLVTGSGPYLHLAASGVQDLDGAVQHVEFYRDDGDNAFEPTGYGIYTGADYFVPIPATVAPPNGTVGLPGLLFADLNANGIYEETAGEDIWFDANGDGLYSGVGEQVWNGGDPWTTAVGTPGIRGRLLFRDTNDNGIYTAGEPVWRDEQDELVGTDNDGSNGWTFADDQPFQDFAGRRYWARAIDLDGAYSGNWVGAIDAAGTLSVPSFTVVNQRPVVEALYVDGIYTPPAATDDRVIYDPLVSLGGGEIGIRGDVLFHDYDSDAPAGAFNSRWDGEEDVWLDANADDLYNAGETQIYSGTTWHTSDGETGIQGNVLFEDVGGTPGAWDVNEPVWAEQVQEHSRPFVLTAVDVHDGLNSGGVGVRKVEFYRDSNYNGVFDPLTDQWLGDGVNVGNVRGGTYNEWQLYVQQADWVESPHWNTFIDTVNWPPRTQTFFAVAQDSVDRWSDAARARSFVTNIPPVIGSLTDTPDPVEENGWLTLTAIGVNDPYGAIDYVAFYRDSQTGGTPGAIDPADLQLGTDNNVADGWSLRRFVDWPSLGPTPAPYTYMAQARDNSGDPLSCWSNTVTTTGEVNARPVFGGTFAEHTNSPFDLSPNVPVAIATGDFNGDDEADIALVYAGNVLSVHLGDGTGEFVHDADYPTGASAKDVLVGDLDGDGNLDLIVSNSGSNTLSVFMGDGTGAFAPHATAPTPGAGTDPTGLAAGDFDGDGIVDIAVTNNSAGDVSILLGVGDGTFVPATQVAGGALSGPIAIVAGHFDPAVDSNLDLAVAESGANQVRILLGDGTGAFPTSQIVGAGTTPVSLAAGSLNPMQDSYADLAVANQGSDDVSVLLAQGDGTFAAASASPIFLGGGAAPADIAIAQFDTDIRNDIVVVNGGTGSAPVILNNGMGRFAAPVTYSLGTTPVAVAVDDLNSDDVVDIVVANSGPATQELSVLMGVKPLQKSPDEVAPGEILTLTASGLRDLDGDGIVQVQFYRDGNGDGVLKVGVDPLLDPDGVSYIGVQNGGQVWQWQGEVTWAVGQHVYFVRALDSRGAWSHPVSESGRVPNPAPVIAGGLLDDPDPVTEGYVLSLVAQNVSDANGVVMQVEFWRDADGDDGLDVTKDEFLGANSTAEGDDFSLDILVTWAPGSQTYFARAQDDLGDWSDVVSTDGVVNGRPVVETLTASPNPVPYGDLLRLTATGVYDTDVAGSIVQVAFYRDTNGNEQYDDGADDYIGNDATSGDGWFIEFPAVMNTRIFFARAQDNDGGWSYAAASAPVNRRPVVTSLSDFPDPVTQGQTLRLEASDVFDIDGYVDAVAFYRDANANGTLESGTDILLGLDTTEGDGWYLNKSVTWPGGPHTYFAIARDNQGVWTLDQDAAVTTGYVNRPPTIQQLQDSPDPLRAGVHNLTLTAVNVQDQDGIVVKVEFWYDKDQDGVLNPDTDQKLGEDISSAGGWTVTVSTAGWSAGYRTYLARALDDKAAWSAVVSATGLVDGPPVIDSLSLTPNPVALGDDLTLIAVNVHDVGDGHPDPIAGVQAVEFYDDTNLNGPEPLVDPLLGTDTDGSDGWSITVDTTGWTPGNHTYYARARDGWPLWSNWVSATGKVNQPPTVGGLVLTPDPVIKGNNLTLTATGVSDVDGTVVQATFYRDNNGNGTLEVGIDIALGTDTSAAGGWAITVSTAGWLAGQHTYFAVATDDDGGVSSPPASAVGTVLAVPPTIGGFDATPDPLTRGDTMTFTITGVVDLDGVVQQVSFYREDNYVPGWQGTGPADDFLGNGTQTAPGVWQLQYTDTAGWDLGLETFYARAKDDDNAWTDPPAEATAMIVNALPEVDELLLDPNPVAAGDDLTMTAIGAGDVDGSVAQVQFWVDLDGDLIPDVGETVLDTTPANGWQVVVDTTGWQSGLYTCYATPRDNDGDWGPPAIAFLTVNERPTIAGLTDTPDPVVAGDNLTLTATGVADADGMVVLAEFYRDANANGTLEPASDLLLGTDISAAGGWQLIVSTNAWNAGTYEYFARAQDDDALWSNVVSATGEVVERPTIAGLTDSPDPVTRGQVLTLTANGVADADGMVVLAEFYRDQNGNGTLEPASDLLLGTDMVAGDGWQIPVDTTAWLPGYYTYFARAQDDDALWSNVVSTTGQVNERPVIVSLTDSPDPVTAGVQNLVQTANGVSDVDGSVVRVEFWRDQNGNGTLEPASDLLLGFDTQSAGGWQSTIDTTGWASGTYTYLARAQDDDGAWSLVVSTTGSVNGAPTIASLIDAPDPVTRGLALTLTATGADDGDGTVMAVWFYRDSDGVPGLNPGADELLGPGVDLGGGTWELAGINTSAWPLGMQTYYARAQDDEGGWSQPVSTTGDVNERPTIGALHDVPDPVTRGEVLTLTATGVQDVDGTVAGVQFWRDENANGTLETGQDLLLGNGVQTGSDWELLVDTTAWTWGVHTYFARAQDEDGAWSLAASTSGDVNERPTIGTFTNLPNPVARGDQLVLTAQGVNDVDGVVGGVQFWRDENGNGTLEPVPGQDVLLGTDTAGADGWQITLDTTTWALGTYTYFARAQDNDGAWSLVASSPGKVNERPTIGSLSDSPDPVTAGEVLTLTAGAVNDVDGTVGMVQFWRDQNGNHTLETNWDLLLGSDSNGADGWSLAASTSGWSLGTYTYMARAQDNDGAWSGIASTTGRINERPTIASLIDSPDPVTRGEALTLTASGVSDVDGIVGMVEFYRDQNANGTIETGVDLLLGSDANGADGWQGTADTTSWASGTYTYLARARDNDLLWSYATAATGQVNERPTIAALTDSPDPVLPGELLTLSATGVNDTDGSVVLVEFWRDENANGTIEPASDLLLGTDASAAGGWQVVVDTNAWQSGNYTYMARAQDDDGAWSVAATANGRVDFILIDSELVDGALISIFDVDASNGISDPNIAWSPAQYVPGVTDVLVIPGVGGAIQAIILFGDGSDTEDLALVLDGNTMLGSLIDLRTSATPFGFLLSEGPVNFVSLQGTVQGGDLNGFVTPGGWALPADVDGDGQTDDPTAVYSAGNVGALIFRGDVNGDIVVDGNLPFLGVFGGDLNGDVVLLGSDVGTILALAQNVGAGWFGGDITGDVVADGNINAVLAIGGSISGSIEAATGSIGTVLALGLSTYGGWTNSSITSPLIHAGNDFGDRIGAVLAVHGGIASTITSSGTIGTVMASGGDLDLMGARHISAGSTINAVQSSAGNILGGGGTDVSVEDGNLWTMQALMGRIDGVAVDVHGTAPFSGQVGSVMATGGGILNSSIHSFGLSSVYTSGNLSSHVGVTGNLGSVAVGGSVAGSTIDVTAGNFASLWTAGDVTDTSIRVEDGLFSSLYAARDFYNSTIEANALSVISVAGRIREDATDGDTDVIHAAIGRFYVSDSHAQGWIKDTPSSFGGLMAYVG